MTRTWLKNYEGLRARKEATISKRAFDSEMELEDLERSLNERSDKLHGRSPSGHDEGAIYFTDKHQHQLKNGGVFSWRDPDERMSVGSK